MYKKKDKSNKTPNSNHNPAASDKKSDQEIVRMTDVDEVVDVNGSLEAAGSTPNDKSDDEMSDGDDAPLDSKSSSDKLLCYTLSSTTNFEGMRVTRIRKIGHDAIASSTNPVETLNLFLEKVANTLGQNGKKKSATEVVNSLLYYIMGSHGSFGIATVGHYKDNNPFLWDFILAKNWLLIDAVLEFLYKKMMLCEGYKDCTKEKFFSIIGKSFICKEFRESHYHSRGSSREAISNEVITAFISRYHINLNLETEGLQSAPISSNIENVELLIELGKTFNEEEIIYFINDEDNSRKDVYIDVNHLEQIFIRMLKDVNVSIKLIESALAKNLPKPLIIHLLEQYLGAPLTDSTDMVALKKYALTYGFKDLYEKCSKIMQEKNAATEKFKSTELPLFKVLLQSKHFDIDHLHWIIELYKKNVEIVDTTDFFEIFMSWFFDFVFNKPIIVHAHSRYYNFSSTYYYNRPEAWSSTNKRVLLDFIQHIFGEFTKRLGNIKKMENFASIEDYVLNRLHLHYPDPQWLSEILNALICFEDSELKGFHERRGNLLKQMIYQPNNQNMNIIFKHSNEAVKDTLEQTNKIMSLIVYKHLIIRGANPEKLLFHYFYKYAVISDITIEEFFGIVDFLMEDEIIQKFTSRTLTAGIVNFLSIREPFLNPVDQLLTHTSFVDFTRRIHNVDWLSILKAHLSNLEFRLAKVQQNDQKRNQENISNEGVITHNIAEALELNITGYLLTQTNNQLPASMQWTDKKAYSPLQYIALVAIKTNYTVIPAHTNFFANSPLFGAAMREALTAMKHYLDNVPILGDNLTFPNDSLKPSREYMCNKLKHFRVKANNTVVSNNPNINMQQKMEMTRNSLITKLQQHAATEIRSHFQQKYPGQSVGNQLIANKLSMLAENNIKQTSFMMDTKRDHELWTLKSIRAYACIIRILSDKPCTYYQMVKNNIYYVCFNLLINNMNLDKLIECFCILDDYFLSFLRENRNYDQTFFWDSIFLIASSLPLNSDNEQFIPKPLLTQIIVNFFRNKFLEDGGVIPENAGAMLDDNDSSFITDALIEKHMQAFLNSIKTELTFGYTCMNHINIILSEFRKPMPVQMTMPMPSMPTQMLIMPFMPQFLNVQAQNNGYQANNGQQNGVQHGQEQHAPAQHGQGQHQQTYTGISPMDQS